MESPFHTLPDLFRQLGLSDDPAAIDQFIASHRPLAPGQRLCDAPFWTSSQAQFLRDDIRDDADWALAADDLAQRLSLPHFDLYAFWRTSATFRVRVALHLKGIVATERLVDLDAGEQRGEAFLKINPLAAIPALVQHGQPPLTQSLAILEFLEELQPQPALLPADLHGRARVRSIAGMLAADTHPRPSPVEQLAKIRPACGGVQTGGNSSAVVDGAAAAVIASGAQAKGRAPLARLVAGTAVGCAPEVMGIGPVPAIRALLERTGLTLDDIALVEINEAFGAQVMACARELALDEARLNVNGGAIAIGHPLAASGLRLSLTVARELKRRGARYGIASACIGGGQGIALLLENPHGKA
jgi:hypothetical protein